MVCAPARSAVSCSGAASSCSFCCLLFCYCAHPHRFQALQVRCLCLAVSSSHLLCLCLCCLPSASAAVSLSLQWTLCNSVGCRARHGKLSTTMVLKIAINRITTQYDRATFHRMSGDLSYMLMTLPSAKVLCCLLLAAGLLFYGSMLIHLCHCWFQRTTLQSLRSSCACIALFPQLDC